MPTDSQRPGVSPGNRVLDPVPALVTEDQIQASSLSVVEEVLGALRHKRQAFSARLQGREVGTITGLSAGIATISGLPGVGFEELVQFPGNLLGMAFNVDAGQVSIVLLGDYAHLRAGDEAERTGRVLDIGVGEELLGRVVDPLGRPLDGQAAPHCGQRLPIERPAKAILDRAPVEVPLQTGIKVVDALVPIGRGQRELILGDRQTGKTTLALDAILNQKDQNVVCVYCAIGQRASAVARVIAKLRQGGAMEYTTVLMSHGDSAPGLSYIAPYAATSIAEFFMEAGRDVLVVYDDLTQHARSYRELSLLLRRPPGREAYPGDIFYLHSRLLERATHLNSELGGGSLTALPVLETEAEDVSAYIPTNLISITDGQIYLSPRLFELGILPAVDVGQSVSRVGGKAQLQSYREVASSLKLAYSQFEELETFSRFGSSLDTSTQKVIDHGTRIRACLKQSEFEHVSVIEQICILLALSEGQFRRIELAQMADAQKALGAACGQLSEELKKRVLAGEKLGETDRQTFRKLAEQALDPMRISESEPQP